MVVHCLGKAPPPSCVSYCLCSVNLPGQQGPGPWDSLPCRLAQTNPFLLLPPPCQSSAVPRFPHFSDKIRRSRRNCSSGFAQSICVRNLWGGMACQDAMAPPYDLWVDFEIGLLGLVDLVFINWLRPLTEGKWAQIIAKPVTIPCKLTFAIPGCWATLHC